MLCHYEIQYRISDILDHFGDSTKNVPFALWWIAGAIDNVLLNSLRFIMWMHWIASGLGIPFQFAWNFVNFECKIMCYYSRHARHDGSRVECMVSPHNLRFGSYARFQMHRPSQLWHSTAFLSTNLIEWQKLTSTTIMYYWLKDFHGHMPVPTQEDNSNLKKRHALKICSKVP